MQNINVQFFVYSMYLFISDVAAAAGSSTQHSESLLTIQG